MEYSLKLNIGKSQLEFKSANVKDLHRVSSVYGALPKRCDCCGSTDIYLSFKNPSGNDYYGIKCTDCLAELNLHQKKEGGAFYVKDGEKMQVWQGAQQQTPPQNRVPQHNYNNVNNAFANPPVNNQPQNDDDIPF